MANRWPVVSMAALDAARGLGLTRAEAEGLAKLALSVGETDGASPEQKLRATRRWSFWTTMARRTVRSHPADPDDRAALRTLALTAHECQVLAAAAYRRAELAYVESDTIEQAHQLDRAHYWQIAAGDKP